MLQKTSFLILFIALLSYNKSSAQAQPTIIYEEFLQAQVSVGGQNILSPFCGGINSTQPCHADLNNDGKNDITIFDHYTETLKTFINVGGFGDEKYRYEPKYAATSRPSMVI